MKQVMLDLETAGTAPNSAIMQIAAIVWTPMSAPAEKHSETVFNRKVSLQSCLLRGMELDPTTLKWWRTQPAHAQAAIGLLDHCSAISEALREFGVWWKLNQLDDETLIWSHGAAFDIPLLDFAHVVCGLDKPWHYRAARDTRTLFAIAKALGWSEPQREFLGVQHDAYWDCLHQIGDVIDASAFIEGLTAPQRAARQQGLTGGF